MATDRHMDSDKAISPADTLRRIELITGVGRRRRWTQDDKARIVAESLEGTGTVSEVARRHGLSPGLLFLWRRQAREGSGPSIGFTPFVPVTIERGAARVPDHDRPKSLIEIDVAEARITVSGPVDAAALDAVLAAVRRKP